VDAAEHFVGLPIPAPSFPPALDDSSIVSEDPEVLPWLTGRAESASKKLEANSFCPSDVSSVCLPSWDETPGPPLAANNNADANT
jgi:hypothetical protein